MFFRTKPLFTYIFPKIRNGEEAHSLYCSHTAGRWLYNNEAQMKARYTPFKLGELLDRAKTLVGSPVRATMKLADTDNRAFLLTHEDGTQIVARIPTPISGPPVITTASEVATMDFLRRLGLPVPKVLAHSTIAGSTEVGSEFIFMEKVEGTSLDRVPHDVLDVDFAQKLADVLRPLVNLRFKCYGSLYYKDQLDPSERIDDFLIDSPEGVDTSPFCVGPITRRDFWDEERGTMDDVYRGPWTSALDYMTDTVTREQKWIERFAKPHMNDSFTCILPFQGTEHDHIELLDRYKNILPHLVPKEPQFLHGHLWHPNLHSGHVFASLSSANGRSKVNGITSCIDWQGSFIAPAFLQLTPPRVCGPWLNMSRDIVDHPAGFDAMEQGKEEESSDEFIAQEKERRMCAAFDRRAFGDMMLERDEGGDGNGVVRWKLPELKARQHLEYLSRRTWQTGLVPFRKFLIDTFLEFDAIAPGIPNPIFFTPEEVTMQFVSITSVLRHLGRADELCLDLRIHPPHGYVRIPQGGNRNGMEYFEGVRDEVEKRRTEFVGEEGVGNEEKRRVRELMWPFRETMGDEPRKCLPMKTVTTELREVLGDDSVFTKEEDVLRIQFLTKDGSVE